MRLAQEAGLGRKQGFVRPVEESVLRFRKYRNARKETKLERETVPPEDVDISLLTIHSQRKVNFVQLLKKPPDSSTTEARFCGALQIISVRSLDSPQCSVFFNYCLTFCR